MARVPNTLQHINEMIGEAEANPQIGVQLLYERREGVLALIRRNNQVEYDRGLETWGKMRWEEFMMALAATRILNGKANYVPTPKQTLDVHLRNIGSRAMKAKGSILAQSIAARNLDLFTP